jgi:hypothetical protein
MRHEVDRCVALPGRGACTRQHRAAALKGSKRPGCAACERCRRAPPQARGARIRRVNLKVGQPDGQAGRGGDQAPGPTHDEAFAWKVGSPLGVRTQGRPTRRDRHTRTREDGARERQHSVHLTILLDAANPRGASRAGRRGMWSTSQWSAVGPLLQGYRCDSVRSSRVS